MVRAQIYDLVETYVTRGRERSVQGVRAYGLTMDGRDVSVVITDVPHEIFVDPAKEGEVGIMDMYHELNSRLMKGRGKRCTRLGCDRCPMSVEDVPAVEGDYAPKYDSCIRDRGTDERAVVSAEQVMRRGFEVYEPEPRAFWRFGLSRTYYAGPARKFLESLGLGVYDFCKDAVESFVLLKNFAGFEWYEWPDDRTEVHFDNFVPAPWCGMAPFRVACFDIETVAREYANRESNAAAYPVGCVCTWDGRTSRGYVLGDEIDTPPGVDEVRCFPEELELLRAVKADLGRAHVWMGWNSNAFDVPYVFRRGARFDPTFCDFEGERRIRFVLDKNVNQKRCYLPGVIFLDACAVMKKDTRTRPYDYKLQTAAEDMNLGSKLDMPYTEIYGAFHGTRAQRTQLVEYCAKDVEIATKAAEKMGVMTKLVAKCRVKRVRPQDELYRGAGFVTTRKVKEYLRRDGFLMPTRQDESREFSTEEGDESQSPEKCYDAQREVQGMLKILETRGYPGGFVRDPIPGIYMGFSVGTLDFKSLYPSIMREYNMCSSTLLKRPGGAPKEWVSTGGFAFAQHVEGVIPKIMREMVQERNRVRGEAKAHAPGSPELDQIDALQTEYKIVANALYGQTGASTSPLFNKAIAKTTCERGAELAQLMCHTIDADPRIPEKWSSEQRAEYAGRMRRYEAGLDDAARNEFHRRRDRFRDDMGLRVVYGDTDSLMIHFAKSSGADQTLEWLCEVADYVNTKVLTAGGNLQMGVEDVCNILLHRKKMYIKYARAVEESGQGARSMKPSPKIKIAGMDSRTKAPVVRAALRTMANLALKDGVDDVSDIFERLIQDIALGRVERSQLKHTMELKRDPYTYENQPHAVAARQLMSAGLPVAIGDRIEFYTCLITNASSDNRASTVIAAELVNDYDLDLRAYALESIQALAPLFCLVKRKRILDIRYYHVLMGSKRLPPIQGEAQMVGGGKKRKAVLTAQAGPMDGFLKRTSAPRDPTASKRRKIVRARGREFDDMLLGETQ